MSQLTKDDIQKSVERCFVEILEEQTDIKDFTFSMDAVLLETGMDSLGFAILVARLEDELGFDPFSEADEAYYPQTFQNFIDFYYQNQS